LTQVGCFRLNTSRLGSDSTPTGHAAAADFIVGQPGVAI
jgi:hypothetical protein